METAFAITMAPDRTGDVETDAASRAAGETVSGVVGADKQQEARRAIERYSDTVQRLCAVHLRCGLCVYAVHIAWGTLALFYSYIC